MGSVGTGSDWDCAGRGIARRPNLLGSVVVLILPSPRSFPPPRNQQVSLIEQEVPDVDQDLKDLMEHIGFKDIAL